MIRRPPRSTQSRSSAASDVYKRQVRRRGEKDRTAYPLGRCGREGGREGFPAATGGARPGSSSRNVTTARYCAEPRHSAETPPVGYAPPPRVKQCPFGACLL